MLHDLQLARRKLEQAVNDGNAELALILARQYLQLYKVCWPVR